MMMRSIVLVFAVLWQFSSIRECSCLWQLHTTNVTRPLQDALNRTTHVAKGIARAPGLLFNETTLMNFTYTVHVGANFSELEVEEFEPDNSTRVAQVDCFGLGKTVATALEWFFRSKPNGSYALDVRFFLSSRKQPRRVQVVLGEQFGLEWTDFRIERRTVMIVHGFLSHGEETWIRDMEKALLEWVRIHRLRSRPSFSDRVVHYFFSSRNCVTQADVNVVVIDWSAGGNTWNYYKAAVNTRIAGYRISQCVTLARQEGRKFEGRLKDVLETHI